MYMYMYMYMYMNMHIYIYIYIHVCVCVCVPKFNTIFMGAYTTLKYILFYISECSISDMAFQGFIILWNPKRDQSLQKEWALQGNG